MTGTFPVSINGRIDWEKINNKKTVNSLEQIREVLEDVFPAFDSKVLIIWDGAHLPVLESQLDRIIANLDDVTAVSFDTWLYSPVHKYVIEFYHEGDVTIGLTEL
jgi:hypothetical protein